MAAAIVICGHKRPFFEEPESPIAIYKKLRHCSPLLPPAAADHTSLANDTDASSANSPSHADNSMVESFVKEMACATSLDDARSRASRTLEVFKRSITAKVSVEFVQENTGLKEKIEGLNREKGMLIKRVVEIEIERKKEYEDRNRLVQNLKELVGQSNEKVRMLEVKNYALAMHLKQAQQSTSSIPMRFHPDVF